MNGFRFLNYTIYKDAKVLYVFGQKFVQTLNFHKKYDYARQLDRALLSVVLNISEGNLKKSDKELARFLETSLCSLNECVACIDLLVDIKLCKKEDVEQFIKMSSNVAKQNRGFYRAILQRINNTYT